MALHNALRLNANVLFWTITITITMRVFSAYYTRNRTGGITIVTESVLGKNYVKNNNGTVS